MKYSIEEALKDLDEAIEHIQDGEYKKAMSTIAWVIFQLEKYKNKEEIFGNR